MFELAEDKDIFFTRLIPARQTDLVNRNRNTLQALAKIDWQLIDFLLKK